MAGAKGPLPFGPVTQPGPRPRVTDRRLAFLGESSQPKLHTLRDDFQADQSNLNLARWQTAVSGGCTIAVTNGELVASVTGTAFLQASCRSLGYHDLDGSEFVIKMVQKLRTSADLSGAESRVILFLGDIANGDSIGFYQQSSGVIDIDIRDNDASIGGSWPVSLTNVFADGTYTWLRIREAGGTVFFDTAADTASNPPVPGDWTNRASVATSALPADTSRVRANIGSAIWSGTPTITQQAVFDAVNTATLVNHGTSGVLVADGGEVDGTASRFALHATSGVLTAGQGKVVGTAQRNTPHATTGDLGAGNASLIGTASRTGVPVSHATDGVLLGQASLAGSSAILRTHLTDGAMAASGGLVVGSASRKVTHTSSGVLAASGGVLVGSSARGKPHATSGELKASGTPLIEKARGSRVDPDKVESIVDAFDDGTLTGWTTFIAAGTGGTVSETGGKLRLNLTSSTVGHLMQASYNTNKDFNGSFAYSKLTSALTTTNSEQGAQSVLGVTNTSVDTGYSWNQRCNGTIQPEWRIAGVSDGAADITYIPAQHAWFRIRESGGTVFWDTAPATANDPPFDGEWVNRHSRTLAADAVSGTTLQTMIVIFKAQIWTGTPGNPLTPADFDCVNSPTRALVAHATSGVLRTDGALVAAAAARRVNHACTGVLRGQRTDMTGVAARSFTHFADGALMGSSAIISANCSTSDVTRQNWHNVQDTGGAWSEVPQTSDPWTPVPDTGASWGSE